MTTPPKSIEFSIGKYRILELAGEGAMGAVYRALDTVLNRVVAIKVMNATIARDADLRDRFLREAQSAGSLQHPNVVTIFDFGEVDGHLFIAMEYVEGTDLESLLAGPDPVTLQLRLEILIDALAGLAYAHSRGIVHRDLKPANIRVTPEPRAKLMDFGVAHLESSNMTKTGVMIGTPNYMAPECITGSQPASTLSDVFSMGAVLYESLTGRKPFRGNTLHALMFSIVEEEPPLPSSIVPGLPKQLDGIVRKAMAKDPAKRYASALELAHALTNVRAALSGIPYSDSVALSTTIANRLGAKGAAAVRDVAAHSVAPRSAARARLMAAAAGVVVVAGGAFFLLRGNGASAATPDTARETGAPVSGVASETPVQAGAGTRAVDAASAPTPPAAPLGAPSSAGSVAAPRTDVAMRGTLPAPTSGAAATRDAGAASLPATSAQPTGTRTSPASVDTATPPPVAPPVASPVVTPPAPASAGPVASPPVTSPATSPTPAPPSPAAVQAELRDIIARYARAISARDVAAVRAAYPAITSQQQQGFDRFFASTRALHATLALGPVELRESTAEGRVSGVYEFTSATGRAERQAVSFRALFERQGERWRLAAVR